MEWRFSLEDLAEEGGGAGGFGLGDVFGGAVGDDGAAVGAGFGADVDEVVCFGHDAGVVFDDDDGVAFVDEAVEDVDELLHVFEVEADGGFFDEVEVFRGKLGGVDLLFDGAAFGEFGDEFEPLGFAAGEGGGGLAELKVAEAGVGEELEGSLEAGVGFEEGGRFVDGHFEDVADGFVIVADFEGSGVVAFAFAGFAVGPGGGEEVHLQLDASVAAAFGAAAGFVVEGKSGGIESAEAGFGELGEELADFVEKFDVGGRAGTGGFADGGLVDFEDGLELFESGSGLEGLFGGGFRLAEGSGGDREAAAHEGGLAAAGDAGEDSEAADREGGVDVF